MQPSNSKDMSSLEERKISVPEKSHQAQRTVARGKKCPEKEQVMGGDHVIKCVDDILRMDVGRRRLQGLWETNVTHAAYMENKKTQEPVEEV